MSSKSEMISRLIGKMTLEQKVGQCFVIGFTGTMITPTIIERIKRYCPAGIRCGLTFRIKTAYYDPYATSPKFAHRVIRYPTGTVKDFVPGLPVQYCTNEEYCAFLNTMKKAALNNDLGIPVHITMDMEGDASADYPRDGIRFFPSCGGIGRTGDTKLAHDVAWAVARELTSLGVSWLHSPVIDVNTEPMNPEIGIRSYSEKTDEVVKFVSAALKGFKEGGIVATGKHYPGRGASSQDAHHGLPVIKLSRKKMMEDHIRPYAEMIDKGIPLPCVMTAHTAYPAIDPSGLPASLSKVFITDILKNELGFKGTVTTDDITMGGIAAKFEIVEACLRSLNAGNDLILLREESPLIDEVIPGLVKAVKNGKLKESRLDDAIARTLSVKYDYGFFRNGGIRDVKKASEGIRDPKVINIAKSAAKKVQVILRDKQKLLPVSKSKKILLIEQINPLHRLVNTQECHPSLLWEQMLKHSDNVINVETSMDFSEDDVKRIKKRLGETEMIVATNYYFRRSADGGDFIQRLHKMTKKPIIVVANTHYPQAVKPEFKTVILTYGSSPECYAEAAKAIFGK